MNKVYTATIVIAASTLFGCGSHTTHTSTQDAIQPTGSTALPAHRRTSISGDTFVKDLPNDSELGFSVELAVPRPIKVIQTEYVSSNSNCGLSLASSADIMIMNGHFYQEVAKENSVTLKFKDLVSGNVVDESIQNEKEPYADWAPVTVDATINGQGNNALIIKSKKLFKMTGISVAAFGTNTISFEFSNNRNICELGNGYDSMRIFFPSSTYHSKAISDLTVSDLKSILGERVIFTTEN
jgi:hypothetical protein